MKLMISGFEKFKGKKHQLTYFPMKFYVKKNLPG